MSSDETNTNKEKSDSEIQSRLAWLREQSFPEDRLLEQIVDLIANEFDFLSVDICLLDTSKQGAIYKAGTSRKKRLAIRINDNSLVGYSLSHGKPRMTNVEQNPWEPVAFSEIAMPIKLHDTVVGAFDIRSTTEIDVSVASSLQSVANDVAEVLKDLGIISGE